MGLLPNQDEINLFVNECDISIELKKKYKAKVTMILSVRKVTDNENTDFWSITEKLTPDGQGKYENLQGFICFNGDASENDASWQKIEPIDKQNKKDPKATDYIFGFGLSLLFDKTAKIKIIYERLIKELIITKGVFKKDRVVLYSNSFSVPCETLIVRLIPYKSWWMSEKTKAKNALNVVYSDEQGSFYAPKIEVYKDYIIQAHMQWKLLPKWLVLFLGASVPIISVLASVIWVEEIQLIIDNYFPFLDQIKGVKK